jgi:uncharacterized protein YbjT (DUF2867 family)
MGRPTPAHPATTDQHLIVSGYLIIGGAGRTGRHIVDRLADRDDGVTIVSRHPGQRPRTGVEAVSGDLGSGVEPGMLAGIDGVVVTVEPPADPTAAARVMHHGVDALARACADGGIMIVLVSQIYVTRAAAHPELAAIIAARGAGERALRDSGAPYVIVRPAWLTDGPASGVRIEQGDTGEGHVSRETVADAVIAALHKPAAAGTTFEIYDTPAGPPDWSQIFNTLRRDATVHTDVH